MAITITKPTVGGSEDSWGTTINTALDTIVLEINSNADGTNTVTPNLAAGWEVGGVAVTSTAAELNILDGVTATAAEISILDGDTSASTVTVESTDALILNDAGTMKQITVDTLNTYIQGQAGGLANVVEDTTPQLGGNLDLNSSNITGTGNISITGQVTLGSWTIYVSGTSLKFKYGATDVFSLSSSGALVVKDNVTAYGSA